jgi:hypothetical protein
MFLAGAKAEAFAGCTVPAKVDQTPPLFDGNFSEFLAKNPGDELLEKQMFNVIRKCTKCSKPCAYTLETCNSCGAPLPTETTRSDNIFLGFIYGLRSSGFPLKISIRHQTENVLVFDDLLALASCHLNAIPTDVYIPDLRFLLQDPPEGLKLISRLEDAAWQCVLTQFWANPAWRKKIIKNSDGFTEAAIKSYFLTGLNFPPSQFQLHIQCIMLPLTPFHFEMYNDGQHFTFGRFFPLEYMRAVLSLNVAVDVSSDTKIEEVISTFADHGVDYKKYHAEFFAQVRQKQLEVQNWNTADFDGSIDGEEVVGSECSKKQLVELDKLVLQNYGRPYADGRPTGTYYQFAKQPRIPNFGKL